MAKPGIERLKRITYFAAMDYWLLVPVLLISMIGLFVLNRVLSSGFDAYPMVFYKQAGAVLIGLLIALTLSLVEVPTLNLIAWIIYGTSLLMLVWVLVDNFSMIGEWGADSWLELPLIGTFQPSELAKIGLAMTSAQIFEGMTIGRLKKWQGGLSLAALYGVPLLLIREQPDLGTSMVILFMLICMIFVWGLRWRFILLGISGLVLAGVLAWLFLLKDFQKSRIITFLYPGHDPAASYNLIQSKRAIASGGLTGNLQGNLVHVPVKESDFIFTAVSEHMGFIGTTALLILIFFFLARSLYVASKIRTWRPALAYTMVGITAFLAFHFIENLGMCVGLLPITGIPLPFVSLGGTAMIVNFLALGVMLCISMERNLNK
ncbi:MAG: FtsW/RodA/SpoVE family cell cycle protein [Saccharofermentanales bacterium]|jgi:rod shape determining protein RodA|nr:rod shape-determining protein RodA [Clostridiaceae bacterium]